MSSPASLQPGAGRRPAFTLVEVMIAMILGILIMGAVLAVALMVSRVAHKTELVQDALATTRRVQEHLTRELTQSVRDHKAGTEETRFRFFNSDGLSPPHFSRLTYRTVVGTLARITTAVDVSALNATYSLDLECGPETHPQVGDYVMVGFPDTGRGLRISAVSDPAAAPGVAHPVSVTFADSIGARVIAAGGTPATVEADLLVNIQRESAYEVMPVNPAFPGVAELRWWPNTINPNDYQVISQNIDASERFMFRPVVLDDPPPANFTDALQLAVGWSFSYRGNDMVAARALGQAIASPVTGGRSDFFANNRATGIVLAGSGDAPMPAGNTEAIGDDGRASTTTSTTSTSTTTSRSTTTRSTSTTATTTRSTSTTSTSRTTTTRTTTTRTTTIKTTSIRTTSTSVPTTRSTVSSSTTVKTTTSTPTTSISDG